MIAGLLSIGASLAWSSNPKLPEVGDPIPPEKRPKFNEWINCGLKEQNGKFKDLLKHCIDKPEKVDVYRLNKTPKHWKHGSDAEALQSPVFTPHATAEQIAACKLCIAVDLELMCKYLDAAATTQSVHDWIKDLFRHETIHWLQYDFWKLWLVTNGELFNHPWDGTGDPAGKNGNPGGGSDPSYEADKCARKLYDLFDECRTAFTETQAVLFGNAKAGCGDDPSYWRPYDDKGEHHPKGYVDEQLDALNACKEKLFGGPNGQPPGAVADAIAKYNAQTPANKPAYQKLKDFADKLNAAKQRMCKDIDQLAAEAAAAKKKYNDSHP